MVTCAISACALEVDVTELVKDDYFAAVLGALKQQGAEPEYVDIDASVGSWRPSPIEVKDTNGGGSSAASDRRKSAAATAAAASPAAAAASLLVSSLVGSTASEAAAGSGGGAPSLKKEVDPNAPTFYDLTGL